MPYYDYVCTGCGKKFEAQQSYEEHDRHEKHDQRARLTCPKCGSKDVRQRISPVSVHTSKKS